MISYLEILMLWFKCHSISVLISLLGPSSYASVLNHECCPGVLPLAHCSGSDPFIQMPAGYKYLDVSHAPQTPRILI